VRNAVEEADRLAVAEAAGELGSIGGRRVGVAVADDEFARRRML
jgi:hypothetical protein